MSSTKGQGSNLEPVNGDARATYPVIGGRAHPDEVKLIDRAALEVGQKRGVFLVEAAIEKARKVLADHAA